MSIKTGSLRVFLVMMQINMVKYYNDSNWLLTQAYTLIKLGLFVATISYNT